MSQSGEFAYAPPLPPGLAGHGDRPLDSATWRDFAIGSLNHLRDQSGQVLANWMPVDTAAEIGPGDNAPGQWYEAIRIPLILRVRPDGYTHGLIVHLYAVNDGVDTTSVEWRWYLMPSIDPGNVGQEPPNFVARDTATLVGSSASSWLSGDSGRAMRLTPTEVARARPLSFSVAKERAATTFGRVAPIMATLIIGCEPQGTANTSTTLRGYHVREFDTGTI